MLWFQFGKRQKNNSDLVTKLEQIETWVYKKIEQIYSIIFKLRIYS